MAFPPGEGEALRVVEMALEVRKDTDLVPWAAERSKETSLQDIQKDLRAVCPGRFSDAEDAIPIVVRLKATLLVEGTPTVDVGKYCFSLITTVLTLFTIPVHSEYHFKLDAAIQLGPGKWSDGVVSLAREDVCMGNPLGNVLFAWAFSGKKGWQRRNIGTVQPDAIATIDGTFSMLEYLRGADGCNRRFAEWLAALVAEAWDGLSPAEKAEARGNPVTWKRFAELHPLAADAAMPPGGTVAVPVPAVPGSAPVPAGPQVVRQGFSPDTRRGFVVFSENGTEHLKTLDWVRRDAIPGLAGEGTPVRILSEGMEGEGLFRIEFEAAE